MTNPLKKIRSFLIYFIYLIGSTVLLLTLGHFLIGAALKIKVSNQKTSISGDKRETLPIYDNYPDKVEFWKEHWKIRQDSHFEPYFHWRRDEYNGKHIKISEDGIRNTVSLQNSNNAKKIFMFGGSTMWGTGVKDTHTIPSFLQKLLGSDYKVFNYGETAYVSTQELNFLLLQLSKGNIPDKVIFYDGVNDTYAGVYSPAIPRDPQRLRNKFKDKNSHLLIKFYNRTNYKKLVNYFLKTKGLNKWENSISPNIKNNTTEVLNLYDEHIKQVKALGKEYGFKSYFFWQPNIYSGDKQTVEYEEKIISEHSEVFKLVQTSMYSKSKKFFSQRENNNIFFLGDIFDNVKEPIYIDYCHLGARGNEIVANEIYRTLEID